MALLHKGAGFPGVLQIKSSRMLWLNYHLAGLACRSFMAGQGLVFYQYRMYFTLEEYNLKVYDICWRGVRDCVEEESARQYVAGIYLLPVDFES